MDLGLHWPTIFLLLICVFFSLFVWHLDFGENFDGVFLFCDDDEFKGV